MKKALVIRGISGSGKSTFAKMFLYLEDCNIQVAIHSTDQYFLDQWGEYKFDPTKLGENHQKNLLAFKKSLRNGYELVICDNTNTQKWEYEKYVQAAEEMGYQVHIITVGDFDVDKCHERCAHDVPKKSIQRQADRWER